MLFWVLVGHMIVRLYVNWGALAPSSLCSALAAITFTTWAWPQLLKVLGALLVKLFEVDLNDFLNQVVHLELVLYYLSYIHNLFALQEVQELTEIFHDFILVHLGRCSLALSCDCPLFLCRISSFIGSSLLLADWLKPLLMVLWFNVYVFAEFIDEDCVCWFITTVT